MADLSQREQPPIPAAHPAQLAKPSFLRALPRFLTVGAVGTVINTALLYLLRFGLRLPIPVASVLATEVAIVTNYIGNELWTFHVRRLAWRRLWRFNAVALVGLLVTVSVLTVLTNRTELPLLWANLIAVAAGAVVNFTANFGWTWRRKG